MRAQIPHAIVVCAVLIGACSAPSGQLTQRELAAYMEQLTQWAPQEAEVGRAVRRMLDTEFADEAEVRRQLTESLPRLEAQLVLLRAYRPSSAELQDVHGAYLRAWEDLRTGYSDVLRGFDEPDQAALGRGRAALLAWRRALPETAERLRELRDGTNEAGPPT